MKVHQIIIPENIQIQEFDLKMIVATKLFEDGRLSSGQACQIAGISKTTFIELLGKYGVSMFGYNFDELEEDVSHA